MAQRRSRASPAADVRPPNKPWVPIPAATPEIGCLSFYLSDDLSPLPVRGVTLHQNNKSDPNLETGTYGLFSTCERQMRASVVSRGLRYIFFVTRRADQRVISGYYELGWYCEGVLNGVRSDYALAARQIHFIEGPVPIAKLPGELRAVAGVRFRTFLLLDSLQTSALRRLLDRRPDCTSEYVSEIDRLERFNLYHAGARCWNRAKQFTWDDAKNYLAVRPSRRSTTAVDAANTSPTGRWRCTACGVEFENKALLKACPSCDVLGSLAPVRKKKQSQP